MLFRKKKLYLTVSDHGRILYDGLWNDLPFSEETILSKSVEYFDDPEPCYIHRDAVQLRLSAELTGLLNAQYTAPTPEFMAQFIAHTGFPEGCILTFSEQ